MDINLLKLFEVCSKQKISFNYSNKNVGKNNIEYDKANNTLSVTLVDLEDENLPNLIENKIIELNNIV